MKIKVIKAHHHYSLGVHEVTEERGNYLIGTGIAEKIEIAPKKEVIKTTEKVQVKVPKKRQVKAKKNEL